MRNAELELTTQAGLEIRRPALIFFAAKAFTWLCLLISAVIISGNGNLIYDFKHAFINWDAIWYLKISAEGYDIPRKCVFFPLMPLLVKILWFVVRDYALAGILLSNVLSFFGALYFYNLVKDGNGRKSAVISLLFFLAAPTALFYSNFYPESLFFMLSVMVFYFARKKQWLQAAIAAGLASATRNYGILLAVPLLWEFFSGRKLNGGNAARAAGLGLIVASGLIAYSVFLYMSYKDPLYFINAQDLWHGRNKLVPPFSALISRLSDAPGFFKMDFDPMKTKLSVLYFCAAIALNIYGFGKVKGPGFVYLTLMTVFLSFQGMLMSLSRYISCIFVFWQIAAVFVTDRKSPLLWASCMAAILFIWQAVINFRWMAGYWVA